MTSNIELQPSRRAAGNVLTIVLICIVQLACSTLAHAQGMKVAHPRTAPPSSTPEDSAPSHVRLKDMASEAGLTFQHRSGEPVNKKFLLEATGSGVAVFDYDGDGLPDIFFVNGKRWQERGDQVSTSHLFKNLGKLKFRDVTKEAGLDHTGWGQGVCVGDYDNDGFEDLFVTYYGRNVLYHNDGHGHFKDVTKEAGLPMDSTRWGTGCSFVDYDRDGHLDIAVANYVSFDPKTAPLPGSNLVCQFKGMPVVCGPRGLEGGKNVLYRNTDGRHFEDVSKASRFDRPSGHYCYSVITADYDDDGWPDIFLACDSTPNILLHNNHDGTFSDVAIPWGTAFNDNGEEQGSMGADAADYLHTGRQSLVVTTFDDDVPALFRNDGNQSFEDVYLHAGLGTRTHQVGWGVAFVDLSNSGWADILMVNGHVYPNVDSLKRESRYREPKYLYQNLKNGRFRDVSEKSGPALLVPESSRGLAYGDLENDGSMSLVVNNLDSRPNLIVNEGLKGNWLTLRLTGTTSNRDAIGARVTVRAGQLDQTAEVRSGCCYLSQSDMRLHFGLGAATSVDAVKVRWPSGVSEEFSVKTVNQITNLVEGQGKKLLEPSTSHR